MGEENSSSSDIAGHIPPSTADSLGPSASKFVNSYKASASASKSAPLLAALGQAMGKPTESGEAFITSYESSANQQDQGDGGSSSSALAMNVSGSQQNGDQQKSIEEQRRQWEFDKGIDPEAKRNRVRPAEGETPSDSGYNLHRVHPKEHVEKPHRAVDIRNKKGGPVVAASDGTVRSTGHEKNLGNHVVVDFDDGMRGVYGHTAPSVKPGQQVRKGEPVGNTDLSGATTGPHLHFEVYDPKTGNKINPQAYIPWRLE